jgi:putative FmdB family regulatory protein
VPLYEYHCLSCELTFEALAPMSAGQRSKACQRCGRRAPRVTSAFSIAHGAAPPAKGEGTAAAVKPKQGPPLCLRYPQMPLLCHMDQKSAERFVAHVQGRGAQYDDAVGAREELRKKRGAPPAAEAAPAVGEHAHGHTHGHSHKGKKGHAHSHRHGHHHAH